MQSENVEHIDVKAFVKAWAEGLHIEITDAKERIAIFKEEFERLCRGSGGGTMDKIKVKADKMRSLTDEALVAYVENRVKKARSEGFNQGFKLRQEVESDISDLVIGLENLIKSISTNLEYNNYHHYHSKATRERYRMGIGDGQSTLSDSTLMNLPKRELVDIIRLLEKNCKVYLNNLNTYSSIVKELTEAKEDLIEVGGIRSNGKNQN